MWQFKARFFVTDLVRIAASVIMAFHPYFFAQLVTSGDDKDRAFLFLILLVGSGLAHWILWHSGDYLASKLINPLFYEMKRVSYSMVWRENYETFIEKPSGKVGHYVNELPKQTFHLYDAYHYGFLPMLASLPVYVVLLYNAAWQNSVIYGTFLFVAGTVLVALARPVALRQREQTDADSTNSGRVFDSFSNFVNVFSFRAQPKEIGRQNVDLDGVVEKEVRAALIISGYWAVASFMIRLVLWPAIIFYGWHLYDTGVISFAAFVVSMAVLFDFTNQYFEIVHQLGSWVRNYSTFTESYSYLFGERNVVKEYYSTQRLSVDNSTLDLGDALEIRDLSFAYPDAPNQPVLNGINIRVAKNEKIGIVGKSGSGKSTLIKILLGFYRPTGGQIFVDGVEVDSDNLSQLYSYVPQDTTLFQESIFYNIAYASNTEVSLEQVEEAAQKAHISEFVETLPDRYGTLVGERGVKLSLGQRQRISIARAFLKQSDLLILDEATSSLDSQTESLVQQSFEELWGDRSMIAIAHRLSTLNNVDRIIVMSEGQIVEQGTKQQLLELGGHFADLWNRQRSGLV